nr:unnamed protein product [Digitaria exilis]
MKRLALDAVGEEGRGSWETRRRYLAEHGSDSTSRRQRTSPHRERNRREQKMEAERRFHGKRRHGMASSDDDILEHPWGEVVDSHDDLPEQQWGEVVDSNDEYMEYDKPEAMHHGSTEKCGFGLIAEDDIKKGEFVVEYVGEVIDDRACEKRLWQMKRLDDTNFYLCEVSSNMVIDATDKGNMSRFINHSCEPNTEMQKWTVDGETRVGIFALRDIKKGEELTYDYKFVQFGDDQDCHCGSSNCRKMLGTAKSVNSIIFRNGLSGTSRNQHVKKKKRKTMCENCLGQILRLWHPRQRKYVGCWVFDFDQETKIHTLQFPDLHLEKFNLKEEEWHFLSVRHS